MKRAESVSRRGRAAAALATALALALSPALAGCSAGAESKGQGAFDQNAEGRTYTTAEAASAGGVLGIELVVPSEVADGADAGEAAGGGDRPQIELADVVSRETKGLLDSATWMRTDLTASDVVEALSMAGESEPREAQEGVPADEAWASYETYASPGL